MRREEGEVWAEDGAVVACSKIGELTSEEALSSEPSWRWMGEGKMAEEEVGGVVKGVREGRMRWLANRAGGERMEEGELGRRVLNCRGRPAEASSMALGRREEKRLGGEAVRDEQEGVRLRDWSFNSLSYSDPRCMLLRSTVQAQHLRRTFPSPASLLRAQSARLSTSLSSSFPRAMATARVNPNSEERFGWKISAKIEPEIAKAVDVWTVFSPASGE